MVVVENVCVCVCVFGSENSDLANVGISQVGSGSSTTTAHTSGEHTTTYSHTLAINC